MPKIEFPLKLQMKRATVRHLHEVLTKLGYQITKAEKSGERFGASTRRAVLDFQQKHGLKPNGEVDQKTAALLSKGTAAPQFVAQGAIRNQDGGPRPGLNLKAFDRNVGMDDALLGEATSDAQGNYSISYTSDKLGGKLAADLVISVYQDGNLLQTSDVIFNASPDVVKDFTIAVDEGPSDPRNLFRTIDPDILLDSAPFTPTQLATRAPKLAAALGQVAQRSVAGTLQAQLGLRSPATAKLVNRIDVAGILAKPQKASAAIISKLRIAGASKKIITGATRRLNSIDVPKAIDAIVRPDLPIGQNPELISEISGARLHRLGRQAGVAETTMDKLRARGLIVSTLSDRSLADAITAGILTSAEAEHVACATGLFRVTDENPDLTAVLLNEASPVTPSVRLQSVKELVRWTASDWETRIAFTPTACPQGVSQADYAASLVSRLGSLFPTDALMARIVTPDTETVRDQIEALHPVLAASPGILKLRSAVNPTATIAALGDHADSLDLLQRIVRAFPGLELDAIASDTARSPGERAEAIVDRVARLRTLYDNNPDVELLRLDYGKSSSDTAKLNFGDIPEAERSQVMRTLKAYQRAYRITSEIEHTMRLVEAGYHSAKQIVAGGRSLFQQNTGLTETQTNKYFKKAQTVTAASNAALGTAIDDLKGGFDLLWASNTDPHFNQYLKRIDGYAELFGRQDYCRCDHCCSVLSPAAYFVDLMHLVDTQITQANFTGAYENHELKLQVRRPDLWLLPLTCDNTNELIPQLRIVCEILASFIAKHAGVTVHACDLDKMIGAIAPRLATAAHSIAQPASLPLRTVEILLAELGTSRAGIAHVLGQDAGAVAIAALGLSPEEVYLITTANTTPAYLDQLFRLQFKDGPGGAGLEAVDAQQLLLPLGLTRAQLGELVQARFVTTDQRQPVTITIAGGKRTPDSIQNDVEWVSGLTRKALDRMLRFTRLWRKLDLSIPELDLLLGCLQDAGLANGINLPVLQKIADTISLRKEPGMSAEDACAMFGDMPKTTPASGRPSLWDRVFNMPGSDGVSLPQDETVFVHPDFAQVPAKAMEVLSLRLQASLRLDSDGLKELIEDLTRNFNLTLLDNTSPGTPSGHPSGTRKPQPDSGPELPRDVTDPFHRHITWEQALRKGFPLTAGNLSMLYRHARLAGMLGLSIKKLFRLIELTPAITSNCITAPEHVFALLEFRAWLQSSGIGPATLSYVTSCPNAEPAAFGNASAIAEGVIADIEKDRALFFQDTVFAQPGGLSDSESRAIIEANPVSWICDNSNSPAACQLADGFDPNTLLVIPAGVNLPNGMTEKDLRTLLIAHHPSTLIPQYLANQLEVNADTLTSYLTMSGAWDPHDPALSRALRRDGVNSSMALADLVTAILPLKALFETLKFDLEGLQFIGAQLALFGIGVPWTVDVPCVQRLVVYRDLLTRTADPFTAKSLNDLLCAFQGTVQFPADGLGLLASLLGADTATVRALQQITPPAKNPFDAYEALRSRCAVVQATRIEPAVLPQAVSTSITELTSACTALRRAFELKYPDDAEREKHTNAVDDALLAVYRDALVAYLMHSLGLPFTNENDLYRHFLIDPQVESCFRTSRVVAAISSVQLYIQRILLNLEQDRMKDVFKLSDSALQGFRKEWDWRQRYRVWDANRKVFLWPENWLTPDVRDDKTPLYEDFESQLRQKEIDEPAILEQYMTYIQGLQELAHLKVAGAYHERSDGDSASILHVFATTCDNPPVHYYRAVEVAQAAGGEGLPHLVWHPWRKVDLKIPVREVSPIIYNKKLYVFWCEIVTTQQNVTSQGNSIFAGYTHKLAVKFSCLNADGRWAPPQQLSLLGAYPFAESDGIVEDPLVESEELQKLLSTLITALFNGTFSASTLNDATKAMMTPRYEDKGKVHSKAIDGYTLRGQEWERIYPEVDYFGSLVMVGAGFQLVGAIDLFSRVTVANWDGSMPLRVPLVWKYSASPYIYKNDSNDSLLYFSYGNQRFCGRAAFAQFMADPALRSRLRRSMYPDNDTKGWEDCCTRMRGVVYGPNGPAGWDESPLVTLPANAGVRIVNDSMPYYTGLTALIQGPDGTLLLRYAIEAGVVSLHRLDSDVPNALARALYARGLAGLLGLEAQQTPESEYNGVNAVANGMTVIKAPVPAHIDFAGPMADYYWELYFHMPMTIACLLNSQARYEDARKWFHYIFDPTAAEKTSAGVNPKDRVWRFLPFREQDQTLRQILCNAKALAAYKQDPFSPHAIARLRHTAYKKAVVMQYVGNLLDWADSLFAQFQMETVNEAVMLYNLANDILGPRPPELGACSEEPNTTRTFQGLSALVENDEWDFLVELEHENGSPATYSQTLPRKLKPIDLLQWGRVGTAPTLTTGNTRQGAEIRLEPTHVTPTENADNMSNNASSGGTRSSESVGLSATVAGSWKERTDPLGDIDVAAGYQMSLTQVPFCIPMNNNLLDLWDRVEDRLTKIRHCLDINGERRDLALFAPEIEPGLLIRARAEGIPLGDILGALETRVPPYRFSFLIEKAKQFASTLDSFGNALHSALEKKDGEELNLLRNSHEKNLLLLNTQVRQWEADAAANAIAEMEAFEASVTHRRDYYKQLIDSGLNTEEWTERISHHVASASWATEATMDFLAGVLQLVPDMGSPFAMKYGGTQLGASVSRIAFGFGSLAQFSNALASSAGLEAGFARREQDWRRLLQQAEDDLALVTKQRKTMELRRSIAERAIILQEKSIEQNEEIAAFFEGKFTQLGFYIWVAKRLREIYRQAFNSTYALAKMAEQAYIFERGDDDNTRLTGNYWDSGHGGLLAADALLADMGNLERRYLETNYRDLEITQSISLAQIDPSALAGLREIGSCSFKIPEYAFDLSYPGHYRRMLRSVRLSVPCVAGPLTNIAATLTLTGSSIRKDPNPDKLTLPPVSVPLGRTNSIATSSANNDGGVFELNFRDERYLPFEGAGAISDWKLELPKAFRAFDYSSISDVIIHLSYTAKPSDALREKMEEENGELLKKLQTVTFSRLFSLRHDFPTEYQRLASAPIDTKVELTIEERHFPYFLKGQSMNVTSAWLGVDLPKTISTENLKLSFNNNPVETWEYRSEIGEKPASNVMTAMGGIAKKHVLSVNNAGGLEPDAGANQPPMTLDLAILRDILLYCEFTIG